MPDAFTQLFDEIFQSTHKAVLAFIASKCKFSDMGDIFQETYIELYRVLQKRGAEYLKNEKAFVMRLARQKLARHYSLAQRMRHFVSLTAITEGDESVDFSDFEASAFATEDFAVNQLSLDEAKRFLQAQPEAVQRVFFLYYEADMTLAEIAKALSMSESGVKNKLYRTLKALRKLLS